MPISLQKNLIQIIIQEAIDDSNFEEYFLNNYGILDEPLATQDFIALNHLSKLTRDNNTIVVQVGEGSDELFMGYEGLDICR